MLDAHVVLCISFKALLSLSSINGTSKYVALFTATCLGQTGVAGRGGRGGICLSISLRSTSLQSKYRKLAGSLLPSESEGLDDEGNATRKLVGGMQ